MQQDLVARLPFSDPSGTVWLLPGDRRPLLPKRHRRLARPPTVRERGRQQPFQPFPARDGAYDELSLEPDGARAPST